VREGTKKWGKLASYAIPLLIALASSVTAKIESCNAERRAKAAAETAETGAQESKFVKHVADAKLRASYEALADKMTTLEEQLAAMALHVEYTTERADRLEALVIAVLGNRSAARDYTPPTKPTVHLKAESDLPLPDSPNAALQQKLIRDPLEALAQ
jgi:hypothetical protein